MEGSEPMFSRFPDILAMPLIVILLWIQTSFHEGFEMIESVVDLNLKLKCISDGSSRGRRTFEVRRRRAASAGFAKRKQYAGVPPSRGRTGP